MKPKWYAVHDKATGELRSVGTVVAPPEELAARGLEQVELGEDSPDHQAQRWDPTTRAFVPRVTRDRIDDIETAAELSDLREVVRGLPKGQADKLKAGLAKLLGPRRYRQDTDPVTLG